jgi:HD-GYP domain-containing protein (c-di-GMP phosphodiesterase class II)
MDSYSLTGCPTDSGLYDDAGGIKMNVHKMKTIGELTEGDIILHPLYRSDGLLFVNKYKRISSSILAHLRKLFPPHLEILFVSTDNELASFIELREYENEAFLTLLEHIVHQFNEYFNVALDIMSFYDERVNLAESKVTKPENHSFHEFLTSPSWQQLNHIFDSEHLLRRSAAIKGLIDERLTEDPSLEIMFENMKSYHDVLAVHSINTAIISFMIGLTLELKDEELIDLTIAALFCNIGFTSSPSDDFLDYLNHGGHQELLSNHIKSSVELMAASPYCRRRNVLLGVYDHHEQYNGTGEPFQKKGQDIHLFGRIIAIAQGYDETVGGYVYEQNVSTLQAVREIWSNKGEKYDPAIVDIFIRRAALYKVGQIILLDDFQKGEVIGFDDYIHHPIYPLVQLADGTIVNLGKS